MPMHFKRSALALILGVNLLPLLFTSSPTFAEERGAALRRLILTDGHAPAQYRTYPVRNLDAWHMAFDVQPGQPLYIAPAERVRVW